MGTDTQDEHADRPKHGLDWVDWDLREALIDLPEASPVLVSFCQGWNMTQGPEGDPVRARLRAALPRLIGTAGDEAREERRAWLVQDWLIRVYLAAWVRAAGLEEEAAALANLPPQTDVAALYAGAATWTKPHQVAYDVTNKRFLDRTQAQAKGSDWGVRWELAELAARSAANYAGYLAGEVAAGSAANYLSMKYRSEPILSFPAKHDTAQLAASLAGREAASLAVNAAVDAHDADIDSSHGYSNVYGIAYRAAFAVLKPTIAELEASAWQLFEALFACD